MERFTTSKNTYTQQVQRNGQIVYRKNGRFTSSRSYHSAQNHAVHTTPAGAMRGREDKIMRGVAYTKDGEWLAGPEAPAYLPHVDPGDTLSVRDLDLVRTIRAQERNYFAFTDQPGNKNLSEREAAQKYADFLDKISRLDWDDYEGRYEVLQEFGWEGYGGTTES